MRDVDQAKDVDQAPKKPAPRLDLSKPPVVDVEHQDLAAAQPPMLPEPAELVYETAAPSAPGGPDEPPEEHAW